MHQEISYIGSFHSVELCPAHSLPEFAFIGRSNVGKSSLINTLFGRKDLARVSKQPGKTRSINLFLVEDAFYMVDLPGYGYARHSKEQRQLWQKMVRAYFLDRPQLTCVFVLLDSNIPLQKADHSFINWLGGHQLPFHLVFTKSDRLKPRKVRQNIEEIRNELRKDWESLPRDFVTSSTSGEGKDELLDYLVNLSGELREG